MRVAVPLPPRTRASPRGFVLVLAGRLAFGDIVHEGFDIFARDSTDGPTAQQRLDVTFNAPEISGEGRSPSWMTAAGS